MFAGSAKRNSRGAQEQISSRLTHRLAGGRGGVGCTGFQSAKFQGPKAVGSEHMGLYPEGKRGGEVHRCGLEMVRLEDLVEIYASIRPAVGQTWPDFYIAREGSILPGPGCCLFNKRTLTVGGEKKGDVKRRRTTHRVPRAALDPRQA